MLLTAFDKNACPGLVALQKFGRMMKVTSLLLLAGCLQLSANSYSQGISLSLKDVPIKTAFKEIQKQSAYQFVYTDEQLAGAGKVSFTVDNATIQKVLDACFKDEPFTYSIEDKFILVKEKEKKIATPVEIENEIKGTVTNEKGDPIEGASIVIKGTKKGTSTAKDGSFTFSDIAPGSTLVISSIGFEKLEFNISNDKFITIHMVPSVSALDEMIIKGYYTTTNRLNTGSVSKVTAEEISKQPVGNVLAALEGRMTGIQVIQNTGTSGGSFTVQIRGQNSLRTLSTDNGNLPLYIVDGVPFTSSSISSALSSDNLQGGNPLSAINPSDIESIEVLKDADATAIYGSRGANGVLLITTKKGKPGKTKVDINYYTGTGKITRKMDLLNTPQYLEMRTEALKSDGLWPLPPSLYYAVPDVFIWDTSRYTDWQNVLLGGKAHISDAQASLSGGNEIIQFLVGGGYHKETTVFPGNFGDQKSSAHFSLIYTSENKKLRSVITTSYVADKNNLLSLDLTRMSRQLAPDAPAAYDSAGNLNWQNFTWDNPLAYTKRAYTSNTNNLISSVNLNYELLHHFQLKMNLGYTKMTVNELSTIPITSLNAAYIGNQGSSQFANSSISTWIVEPQIEFRKNIGKSKLSVLAGTTFQQNSQDGITLQATGFVNDALIANIQAAKTISVLASNQILYKYAASFGRVNYNWKEKIIINLTGRRDGSTRFGPGKQFANFGAIGTAWIFTNEPFIKNNLSFLSYGKLRTSFGTTGSDQIQNYGYLDSYSPTTYPYQTGGLSPTRLANPDYAWEINRKIEAALEIGVIEDRILFSTNFYLNRSSNQLVGYPLSVVTGFSSVQYNLPATVQNCGWEFELKSTPVKLKNLSWNTAINVTLPGNKLISYPNIASSSYANTYTVGQSLYTKKLYHYLGVDSQTGIYNFTDVDKNGNISTPKDLQIIKHVSQDFFGGLVNNIEYKGFQLNIFLQFTKQTGYNYFRNTLAPGTQSNQPVLVMTRWQKNGDITDVQRFTLINSTFNTASSNAVQSDKIISDASFVRLKNIYFAYKLSTSTLNKMKINNLILYIQGQNLLTITHYIGLDPENQNPDVLPPLKMVTAGIQITL